MSRYGSNPQPPKWRPLGVEIGTVNNPDADGAGHPSVAIPRLGIQNIVVAAVLFDFDPATAPAGTGPHTHNLTGPTFHPGDQVLLAFQGAIVSSPIVLGRCG